MSRLTIPATIPVRNVTGRSRHTIAAQAPMTAGKLHPDKKIAKAARAASAKAASVRNSPRRG